VHGTGRVDRRPIVTLTAARRQFNATVLSANRQKWIESLRDMIAELLSLLVAAAVIKSRWKAKWDQGRGPLGENPALLEKVERMVLSRSKIGLLTKPSKPDHQQPCAAIDAAFNRLLSEESHEVETESDIQGITALAQSILKREWQRVKRGV